MNLLSIASEGVPACLKKAESQKKLLPTIAAFAVFGLLADQGGQQDDYQPGVDFHENMRRRRAALRGRPVVYEDEESTF